MTDLQSVVLIGNLWCGGIEMEAVSGDAGKSIEKLLLQKFFTPALCGIIGWSAIKNVVMKLNVPINLLAARCCCKKTNQTQKIKFGNGW